MATDYHIVGRISINDSGVEYTDIGYVSDIETAKQFNLYHSEQNPCEYIVHRISESDESLVEISDIENPEGE